MFYGCKDPRFNAFNIDLQPIDLVIETLNTWEKIYCKFINIQSQTQAIGWSWLINGFGEKKISFDALLPIQLENRTVKVNEGYNKPTEETLEVLARLIELKRVPHRVIQNLAHIGLLEHL